VKARRAVTSSAHPLLVRLRRLRRSTGAARREGLVWLEGEHLCRAAVQAHGPIAMALGTPEAWASPALAPLLAAAAEAIEVAPAMFAELSELPSPAAIAFVLDAPPVAALDPDAATLVLDRLQDAGNAGSLLRSAAAFGFGQVVALVGTVALWSPKVLRAGMGAHFALRIVEDLSFEGMQALRVPLFTTSSHGGVPLPEATLPWPCGFVLGNEGRGVAPAIEARAAGAVRIPQPGGGESLNVAAAGAICCYAASLRAAAAATRR
jgi:TrmH family RNA methyltransferase